MLLWIGAAALAATVVAGILGARAARRNAVATTMSEAWIAEHVETDGKTGHGF